MSIGTTKAAELLGVSSARIRQLLLEGRIEGAYKIGKCWAIPLFHGKPHIKKGTRGPKPYWRSGRKPATKFIHVNRHAIAHNQKSQENLPVISVKQGKHNLKSNEVFINGPSRIVYRPDAPKSFGARVWIETVFDVELVTYPAIA
ncbi:MAG: helix-turn-helix domain-containing protein [Moorea sp. SIO2B7]|nr:helix-turn-helix domain-containing protein [Moorena sp. SIO2B7]